MALTFVYGNSGNGKSEYIYQKIADMAECAPYQHYFVVVPEQFTLKTQRLFVEHAKNGVILNVDVVSFERLAYRVFDELGIHHTIMEETGKSLILRRIVSQQADKLTVLRGSLTKMGYIGELKSILSELMQYGISPEDLADFLAKKKQPAAPGDASVSDQPIGNHLYEKLSDILQIYRAFTDYLKEGYVTAETVPQVLAESVASSTLLNNAVFVFDGFTGFTPVQMKVLRALMSTASKLYVTVTLDTRERPYRLSQQQELFFMSHKLMHSLMQTAAETGCAVTEPVCIAGGENSRFLANAVLRHLEQNLFRVKSSAFDGECADGIRVFSCASPKAELTFAVAKICALVRSGDYRYRDFAIVAGNADSYANYAPQVFARYDVPYFVDAKQTVFYHPLIELIRAVMEIAETDYSQESVFRCLRTGLCGFSAEEIDLLENYCIENGIRFASRWKKSFQKPISRHGRVKREESVLAELLSRIDGIRERVYAQTEAVVALLKKPDATVGERTQGLYTFLCELQVEEQLRRQKEVFEQGGEEELAAAYRQIYKIVIDLFDKLVALLGTETMTVAEYADVLEAGFAAAKIGAIPQGNDCVILGDIERTRLDGVKILFFLGVNDGQIPKKAGRQSLLSQYDREVLESRQLELSPGERQQMFLQRFYLYLNLTKPSDALYVTYMRLDQDGKAVRPSYLIGVLKRLFSRLNIEEIEADAMLPVVTAKSAVDTYLTGLLLSDGGEASDPEWRALHRWFLQKEQWKETIQTLFDAHFSVYEGEMLGSELARLLYGTVLVNSVTRLELFAKCAFAHFLEYGLKLSERKEFAFESMDMGTMFHAILQHYCLNLEKQYTWESVTDEQREQLLTEAMEETLAELPHESLLASSRSAYVLERIRRIMQRSIWALTEQLRRGDFRPEGYEVDFSVANELTPELLMRTVGSVDRLDVYETDDKIYVKVVDYKSGKRKFQLLSLYYGMQLQLVLYLDAATEKLKSRHPDKEIVPAGIFYFHLDDPMVEDSGAFLAESVCAGADEPEKAEERHSPTPPTEEILQQILEQMKPNGLVSADADVYVHMDHGLIRDGHSAVIPVALKKDGTLGKSGSSVATTAQFTALTDYVRESIQKSGRSMLEGEISAAPFRLKEQTGCDYCSFRAVCGFERKLPGYHYQKAEPLKDEEIWNRLER